ncbi:hypothetical protein MPTK1_5g23630 [Marchantia polymorpha subsp. ruderalis]|uniref:Uncharacterized protein n=2 Tax=Marchantia polymorpha TaxID=3197 RepID=A0AAF6BLJ5_MARPO|nr:hypothetical protein MARPO_0010s0093 [Marchantia polymorpha]BBN12879.1 hypothetical protein Mp_5g23630 [Marchantia polymorpha subsp. ruderalis]|eukprot:PTQ46695.1 hypothetical protein MARPO_0010s0093 [Marchantia polymorpha]
MHVVVAEYLEINYMQMKEKFGVPWIKKNTQQRMLIKKTIATNRARKLNQLSKSSIWEHASKKISHYDLNLIFISNGGFTNLKIRCFLETTIKKYQKVMYMYQKVMSIYQPLIFFMTCVRYSAIFSEKVPTTKQGFKHLGPKPLAYTEKKRETTKQSTKNKVFQLKDQGRGK